MYYKQRFLALTYLLIRGIRGHFLVDTALSSIVLGRAYGVNLSM